jgi:hypothetical protein
MMSTCPNASECHIGEGIYIRGQGLEKFYGHVLLRLMFREDFAEHQVEVSLKEEAIPRSVWPAMQDAVFVWLGEHAAVLGGKKVYIHIFDGTWVDDAKYSGHALAVPFAMQDAARKAGILSR